MNSVPQLIQTVEAAGGRFVVDGGRLGIVPSSAAAPVLAELRKHKPEIIALIQSRASPDAVRVELSPTELALPPGTRLVRWEPKDAPVKLSPCSTVTNVDLFVRSTLRQLEAQLSGKHWIAGGWGLSSLLARLEACGCVVALDDPNRALQ